MFVLDDDGNIVNREITYVPGLYKIFDEILVNAADNKQRDKKMDTIKIDIKPEENCIKVRLFAKYYHELEMFIILLSNMIWCHTFSFADLQQRQRHSSRTSRKRKHVRPNHDLWTLADILQLQRRRRKGNLDSGNANSWSTVQFVVVYLVDEIRSPSYHETPYAKAYQTQPFVLA